MEAEEDPEFQGILDSIRGICFFGTPHRENGARPLEMSLRMIANTASVSQQNRLRLAECLGSRAGIFRDINRRFSSVGFRIINFFETEVTPYLGSLVCCMALSKSPVKIST
jgi:hypothetical protein